MRKLITIALALLATTALLGLMAAGAGAAGKGRGGRTKVSGLDEEWTMAALEGDLFEGSKAASSPRNRARTRR